MRPVTSLLLALALVFTSAVGERASSWGRPSLRPAPLTTSAHARPQLSLHSARHAKRGKLQHLASCLPGPALSASPPPFPPTLMRLPAVAALRRPAAASLPYAPRAPPLPA